MPKFFEDHFLVLPAYPHSRVLHADADEFGKHPRLDMHGPLCGRELHRIAHQVVDDLFQPGRVPFHHQVFGNGVGELDLPGFGQRSHHGHHFWDGLTEAHRFRAKYHLVRLDLGQIKDVVDQLQQVRGAIADVAEPAALALGGRPARRVYE